MPTLGTIKKILFQLIASQIVYIQFDSKENEVILGPGRATQNSTEMAMNIDSFWDDIKSLD